MKPPATPSIRRGALLAAALISVALPTLPSRPLWAQAQVGTAIEGASRLPASRLQKAVTMARSTVERRHGGSAAYSPSDCLQRSDGGDCLIEDGEEGFVFRIPGGPPGWQEAGQRPSRETVIRISLDGSQLVQVLYDGSPRPWKGRAKRRSGIWS
jgi:hypothetical protein